MAAVRPGGLNRVGALGTLGIALAGGSAGALLTLVAGIPEQVKHHDRQVADYDDDLAQWISDEMVRVERAFVGKRNEFAAMGQHESGAYLHALAHLKEEALHAYRDQERIAERKRAALRDAEGLRHRLWRKLARRGELPELETPTTARPLLNLWRGQVERQGAVAPVSDPTKRPLSWALEKYATDETRERGWPDP